MPGGIGQSIKMILKETSGVALDVSGNGDATSRAMIVAQLSRAMEGEEALRELRVHKGQAGSKPCALCRNVLYRKCDYLRCGIIVTDARLDASKIRRNDDATIIAILERRRPDRNSPAQRARGVLRSP
eukprot:2398586-Pyramimonas_sp.AAC.1